MAPGTDPLDELRSEIHQGILSSRWNMGDLVDIAISHGVLEIWNGKNNISANLSSSMVRWIRLNRTFGLQIGKSPLGPGMHIADGMTQSVTASSLVFIVH